MITLLGQKKEKHSQGLGFNIKMGLFIKAAIVVLLLIKITNTTPTKLSEIYDTELFHEGVLGIHALRIGFHLRNNLINILGYILNRPDGPHGELYHYMSEIETGIRLGTIDVFQLIPVIADNHEKDIITQLKAIFDKLSSDDRYEMCNVKCSAKEVFGKIKKYRDLISHFDQSLMMTGIINNERGMTTARLSSVGALISKSFKNATREEEEITQLFGSPTVLEIFREAKAKKVPLNQYFFGYLIPFYGWSIKNVNVQYTVLQLSHQLVSQKRFGLYSCKVIGFQLHEYIDDPVRLLEEYLDMLSTDACFTNYHTIPMLKDELSKKSNLRYLDYKKSFGGIFVQLNSLGDLLYVIDHTSYPVEVVLARDRVVDYLRKVLPYVNTRSFVPYAYKSKEEMVYAFLNYMAIKTPFVNPAIQASINAIKAHLVLKISPQRLTSNLLVELLDAWLAPDLNDDIREQVLVMKGVLIDEKIRVGAVLSKSPKRMCYQVLSCYLEAMAILKSDENFSELNDFLQFPKCIVSRFFNDDSFGAVSNIDYNKLFDVITYQFGSKEMMKAKYTLKEKIDDPDKILADFKPKITCTKFETLAQVLEEIKNQVPNMDTEVTEDINAIMPALKIKTEHFGRLTTDVFNLVRSAFLSRHVDSAIREEQRNVDAMVQGRQTDIDDALWTIHAKRCTKILPCYNLMIDELNKEAAMEKPLRNFKSPSPELYSLNIDVNQDMTVELLLRIVRSVMPENTDNSLLEAAILYTVDHELVINNEIDAVDCDGETLLTCFDMILDTLLFANALPNTMKISVFQYMLKPAVCDKHTCEWIPYEEDGSVILNPLLSYMEYLFMDLERRAESVHIQLDCAEIVEVLSREDVSYALSNFKIGTSKDKETIMTGFLELLLNMYHLPDNSLDSIQHILDYLIDQNLPDRLTLSNLAGLVRYLSSKTTDPKVICEMHSELQNLNANVDTSDLLSNSSMDCLTVEDCLQSLKQAIEKPENRQYSVFKHLMNLISPESCTLVTCPWLKEKAPPPIPKDVKKILIEGAELIVQYEDIPLIIQLYLKALMQHDALFEFLGSGQATEAATRLLAVTGFMHEHYRKKRSIEGPPPLKAGNVILRGGKHDYNRWKSVYEDKGHHRQYNKRHYRYVRSTTANAREEISPNDLKQDENKRRFVRGAPPAVGPDDVEPEPVKNVKAISPVEGPDEGAAITTSTTSTEGPASTETTSTEGPSSTGIAPAEGPPSTDVAPAEGPSATEIAPAEGPSATEIAPAEGPSATEGVSAEGPSATEGVSAEGPSATEGTPGEGASSTETSLTAGTVGAAVDSVQGAGTSASAAEDRVAEPEGTGTSGPTTVAGVTGTNDRISESTDTTGTGGMAPDRIIEETTQPGRTEVWLTTVANDRGFDSEGASGDCDSIGGVDSHAVGSGYINRPDSSIDPSHEPSMITSGSGSGSVPIIESEPEETDEESGGNAPVTESVEAGIDGILMNTDPDLAIWEGITTFMPEDPITELTTEREIRVNVGELIDKVHDVSDLRQMVEPTLFEFYQILEQEDIPPDLQLYTSHMINYLLNESVPIHLNSKTLVDLLNVLLYDMVDQNYRTEVTTLQLSINDESKSVNNELNRITLKCFYLDQCLKSLHKGIYNNFLESNFIFSLVVTVLEAKDCARRECPHKIEVSKKEKEEFMEYMVSKFQSLSQKMTSHYHVALDLEVISNYFMVQGAIDVFPDHLVYYKERSDIITHSLHIIINSKSDDVAPVIKMSTQNIMEYYLDNRNPRYLHATNIMQIGSRLMEMATEPDVQRELSNVLNEINDKQNELTEKLMLHSVECVTFEKCIGHLETEMLKIPHEGYAILILRLLYPDVCNKRKCKWLDHIRSDDIEQIKEKVEKEFARLGRDKKLPLILKLDMMVIRDFFDHADAKVFINMFEPDPTQNVLVSFLLTIPEDVLEDHGVILSYRHFKFFIDSMRKDIPTSISVQALDKLVDVCYNATSDKMVQDNLEKHREVLHTPEVIGYVKELTKLPCLNLEMCGENLYISLKSEHATTPGVIELLELFFPQQCIKVKCRWHPQIDALGLNRFMIVVDQLQQMVHNVDVPLIVILKVIQALKHVQIEQVEKILPTIPHNSTDITRDVIRLLGDLPENSADNITTQVYKDIADFIEDNSKLPETFSVHDLLALLQYIKDTKDANGLASDVDVKRQMHIVKNYADRLDEILRNCTIECTKFSTCKASILECGKENRDPYAHYIVAIFEEISAVPDDPYTDPDVPATSSVFHITRLMVFLPKKSGRGVDYISIDLLDEETITALEKYSQSVELDGHIYEFDVLKGTDHTRTLMLNMEDRTLRGLLQKLDDREPAFIDLSLTKTAVIFVPMKYGRVKPFKINFAEPDAWPMLKELAEETMPHPDKPKVSFKAYDGTIYDLYIDPSVYEDTLLMLKSTIDQVTPREFIHIIPFPVVIGKPWHAVVLGQYSDLAWNVLRKFNTKERLDAGVAVATRVGEYLSMTFTVTDPLNVKDLDGIKRKYPLLDPYVNVTKFVFYCEDIAEKTLKVFELDLQDQSVIALLKRMSDEWEKGRDVSDKKATVYIKNDKGKYVYVYLNFDDMDPNLIKVLTQDRVNVDMFKELKTMTYIIIAPKAVGSSNFIVLLPEIPAVAHEMRKLGIDPTIKGPYSVVDVPLEPLIPLQINFKDDITRRLLWAEAAKSLMVPIAPVSIKTTDNKTLIVTIVQNRADPKNPVKPIVFEDKEIAYRKLKAFHDPKDTEAVEVPFKSFEPIKINIFKQRVVKALMGLPEPDIQRVLISDLPRNKVTQMPVQYLSHIPVYENGVRKLLYIQATDQAVFDKLNNICKETHDTAVSVSMIRPDKQREEIYCKLDNLDVVESLKQLAYRTETLADPSTVFLVVLTDEAGNFNHVLIHFGTPAMMFYMAKIAQSVRAASPTKFAIYHSDFDKRPHEFLMDFDYINGYVDATLPTLAKLMEMSAPDLAPVKLVNPKGGLPLICFYIFATEDDLINIPDPTHGLDETEIATTVTTMNPDILKEFTNYPAELPVNEREGSATDNSDSSGKTTDFPTYFEPDSSSEDTSDSPVDVNSISDSGSGGESNVPGNTGGESGGSEGSGGNGGNGGNGGSGDWTANTLILQIDEYNDQTVFTGPAIDITEDTDNAMITERVLDESETVTGLPPNNETAIPSTGETTLGLNTDSTTGAYGVITTPGGDATVSGGGSDATISGGASDAPVSGGASDATVAGPGVTVVSPASAGDTAKVTAGDREGDPGPSPENTSSMVTEGIGTTSNDGSDYAVVSDSTPTSNADNISTDGSTNQYLSPVSTTAMDGTLPAVVPEPTPVPPKGEAPDADLEVDPETPPETPTKKKRRRRKREANLSEEKSPRKIRTKRQMDYLAMPGHIKTTVCINQDDPESRRTVMDLHDPNALNAIRIVLDSRTGEKTVIFVKKDDPATRKELIRLTKKCTTQGTVPTNIETQVVMTLRDNSNTHYAVTFETDKPETVALLKSLSDVAPKTAPTALFVGPAYDNYFVSLDTANDAVVKTLIAGASNAETLAGDPAIGYGVLIFPPSVINMNSREVRDTLLNLPETKSTSCGIVSISIPDENGIKAIKKIDIDDHSTLEVLKGLNIYTPSNLQNLELPSGKPNHPYIVVSFENGEDYATSTILDTSSDKVIDALIQVAGFASHDSSFICLYDSFGNKKRLFLDFGDPLVRTRLQELNMQSKLPKTLIPNLPRNERYSKHLMIPIEQNNLQTIIVKCDVTRYPTVDKLLKIPGMCTRGAPGTAFHIRSPITMKPLTIYWDLQHSVTVRKLKEICQEILIEPNPNALIIIQLEVNGEYRLIALDPSHPPVIDLINKILQYTTHKPTTTLIHILGSEGVETALKINLDDEHVLNMLRKAIEESYLFYPSPPIQRLNLLIITILESNGYGQIILDIWDPYIVEILNKNTDPANPLSTRLQFVGQNGRYSEVNLDLSDKRILEILKIVATLSLPPNPYPQPPIIIPQQPGSALEIGQVDPMEEESKLPIDGGDGGGSGLFVDGDDEVTNVVSHSKVRTLPPGGARLSVCFIDRHGHTMLLHFNVKDTIVFSALLDENERTDMDRPNVKITLKAPGGEPLIIHLATNDERTLSRMRDLAYKYEYLPDPGTLVIMQIEAPEKQVIILDLQIEFVVNELQDLSSRTKLSEATHLFTYTHRDYVRLVKININDHEQMLTIRELAKMTPSFIRPFGVPNPYGPLPFVCFTITDIRNENLHICLDVTNTHVLNVMDKLQRPHAIAPIEVTITNLADEIEVYNFDIADRRTTATLLSLTNQNKLPSDAMKNYPILNAGLKTWLTLPIESDTGRTDSYIFDVAEGDTYMKLLERSRKTPKIKVCVLLYVPSVDRKTVVIRFDLDNKVDPGSKVVATQLDPKFVIAFLIKKYDDTTEVICLDRSVREVYEGLMELSKTQTRPPYCVFNLKHHDSYPVEIKLNLNDEDTIAKLRLLEIYTSKPFKPIALPSTLGPKPVLLFTVPTYPEPFEFEVVAINQNDEDTMDKLEQIMSNVPEYSKTEASMEKILSHIDKFTSNEYVTDELIVLSQSSLVQDTPLMHLPNYLFITCIDQADHLLRLMLDTEDATVVDGLVEISKDVETTTEVAKMSIVDGRSKSVVLVQFRPKAKKDVIERIKELSLRVMYRGRYFVRPPGGLARLSVFSVPSKLLVSNINATLNFNDGKVIMDATVSSQRLPSNAIPKFEGKNLRGEVTKFAIDLQDLRSISYDSKVQITPMAVIPPYGRAPLVNYMIVRDLYQYCITINPNDEASYRELEGVGSADSANATTFTFYLRKRKRMHVYLNLDDDKVLQMLQQLTNRSPLKIVPHRAKYPILKAQLQSGSLIMLDTSNLHVVKKLVELSKLYDETLTEIELRDKDGHIMPVWIPLIPGAPLLEDDDEDVVDHQPWLRDPDQELEPEPEPDPELKPGTEEPGEESSGSSPEDGGGIEQKIEEGSDSGSDYESINPSNNSYLVWSEEDISGQRGLDTKEETVAGDYPDDSTGPTTLLAESTTSPAEPITTENIIGAYDDRVIDETSPTMPPSQDDTTVAGSDHEADTEPTGATSTTIDGVAGTSGTAPVATGTTDTGTSTSTGTETTGFGSSTSAGTEATGTGSPTSAGTEATDSASFTSAITGMTDSGSSIPIVTEPTTTKIPTSAVTTPSETTTRETTTLTTTTEEAAKRINAYNEGVRLRRKTRAATDKPPQADEVDPLLRQLEDMSIIQDELMSLLMYYPIADVYTSLQLREPSFYNPIKVMPPNGIYPIILTDISHTSYSTASQVPPICLDPNEKAIFTALTELSDAVDPEQEHSLIEVPDTDGNIVGFRVNFNDPDSIESIIEMSKNSYIQFIPMTPQFPHLVLNEPDGKIVLDLNDDRIVEFIKELSAHAGQNVYRVQIPHGADSYIYKIDFQTHAEKIKEFLASITDQTQPPRPEPDGPPAPTVEGSSMEDTTPGTTVEPEDSGVYPVIPVTSGETGSGSEEPPSETDYPGSSYGPFEPTEPAVLPIGSGEPSAETEYPGSSFGPSEPTEPSESSGSDSGRTDEPIISTIDFFPSAQGSGSGSGEPDRPIPGGSEGGPEVTTGSAIPDEREGTPSNSGDTGGPDGGTTPSAEGTDNMMAAADGTKSTTGGLEGSAEPTSVGPQDIGGNVDATDGTSSTGADLEGNEASRTGEPTSATDAGDKTSSTGDSDSSTDSTIAGASALDGAIALSTEDTATNTNPTDKLTSTGDSESSTDSTIAAASALDAAIASTAEDPTAATEAADKTSSTGDSENSTDSSIDGGASALDGAIPVSTATDKLTSTGDSESSTDSTLAGGASALDGAIASSVEYPTAGTDTTTPTDDSENSRESTTDSIIDTDEPAEGTKGDRLITEVEDGVTTTPAYGGGSGMTTESSEVEDTTERESMSTLSEGSSATSPDTSETDSSELGSGDKTTERGSETGSGNESATTGGAADRPATGSGSGEETTEPGSETESGEERTTTEGSADWPTTEEGSSHTKPAPPGSPGESTPEGTGEGTEGTDGTEPPPGILHPPVEPGHNPFFDSKWIPTLTGTRYNITIDTNNKDIVDRLKDFSKESTQNLDPSSPAIVVAHFTTETGAEIPLTFNKWDQTTVDILTQATILSTGSPPNIERAIDTIMMYFFSFVDRHGRQQSYSLNINNAEVNRKLRQMEDWAKELAPEDDIFDVNMMTPGGDKVTFKLDLNNPITLRNLESLKEESVTDVPCKLLDPTKKRRAKTKKQTNTDELRRAGPTPLSVDVDSPYTGAFTAIFDPSQPEVMEKLERFNQLFKRTAYPYEITIDTPGTQIFNVKLDMSNPSIVYDLLGMTKGYASNVVPFDPEIILHNLITFEIPEDDYLLTLDISKTNALKTLLRLNDTNFRGSEVTIPHLGELKHLYIDLTDPEIVSRLKTASSATVVATELAKKIPLITLIFLEINGRYKPLVIDLSDKSNILTLLNIVRSNPRGDMATNLEIQDDTGQFLTVALDLNNPHITNSLINAFKPSWFVDIDARSAPYLIFCLPSGNRHKSIKIRLKPVIIDELSVLPGDYTEDFTLLEIFDIRGKTTEVYIDPLAPELEHFLADIPNSVEILKPNIDNVFIVYNPETNKYINLDLSVASTRKLIKKFEREYDQTKPLTVARFAGYDKDKYFFLHLDYRTVYQAKSFASNLGLHVTIKPEFTHDSVVNIPLGGGKFLPIRIDLSNKDILRELEKLTGVRHVDITAIDAYWYPVRITIDPMDRFETINKLISLAVQL